MLWSLLGVPISVGVEQEGLRMMRGPVGVPTSIRGTWQASSMVRGPNMLRGSGGLLGVPVSIGDKWQRDKHPLRGGQQRRHTAMILGWHTCPADVRWCP